MQTQDMEKLAKLQQQYDELTKQNQLEKTKYEEFSKQNQLETSKFADQTKIKFQLEAQLKQLEEQSKAKIDEYVKQTVELKKKIADYELEIKILKDMKKESEQAEE